MNFPEFWGRSALEFDGKEIACWGWSNNNLAEAYAMGRTRAQRLIDLLRRGKPAHRGYYGDRPFREEVLRKFAGTGNELEAVLTRNSYGCIVLNTARAMFVDVDIPELENGGGGFLGRLFGKPSPDDLLKKATERIANWHLKNPAWSWRIYRTRAGLRALATHEPVRPENPVTNQVFDAFGADPLYRRLCENQKCYRARLTPKPWRIGLRAPSQAWPWHDAKAEAAFKKWQEKYIAESGNYATCQLIQVMGHPSIHPALQEFVQLHDQLSRAESGLPLA